MLKGERERGSGSIKMKLDAVFPQEIFNVMFVDPATVFDKLKKREFKSIDISQGIDATTEVR